MWLAIQYDPPADNLRIARKAPSPEIVTDDYHRLSISDIVVLLSEGSAEQRIYTEHRKKAAGNEVPFEGFSLPIHHYLKIGRPESADSSQQLSLSAHSLIEIS